MLKEKIIDWLEEKYDGHYSIDYEKIASIMNEYIEEDEEAEGLDFKRLHDLAIERLEDDGGVFPNERDYDSEDYE